jgi:hypothetical protein
MYNSRIPLVDVSCNLCCGEDTVVLFAATDRLGSKLDTFECTSPGHGEQYQVVRCRQCGLRYSSPRPNEERLNAEYQQVEDPMYERELEGRLTTFRRNLKLVETFCKPGTVLDIGACMGVFLHLAQLNGWDVNDLNRHAGSRKKHKNFMDSKSTSGVIALHLKSTLN